MKKKIEFSKALLISITFVWFISILLGFYVIIAILFPYPEYAVQALLGMFTFVATPFGIALGFFIKKAEKENIHKNPDIQTIEQYNQVNGIVNGFDTNLDEISQDNLGSSDSENINIQG